MMTVMATAAKINSASIIVTDLHEKASKPRVVNCVMSARSLAYSRCCLASLLKNSAEPLLLRLITDSADDAAQLNDAFGSAADGYGHMLEIFDKDAADSRAAIQYRGRPALLAFRNGHPCWRKVTDPELFAGEGDEVITIDPDVFFPNRFVFEDTPASGLMLMWQPPNCLLPERLVEEVFRDGVPLADHTDIGVCQYRAPLPLDFLEEFLIKIPTADYARSMHVESIIWAALALHMGGGYLDPRAWHCFQNSVAGRLERKLGREPIDLLRRIDFTVIKAFHAGGAAKDWLPGAEQAGILGHAADCDRPLPASMIKSFTRYSRAKFGRKLKTRALARKIGLYELLAK